MNQCTAYRTFVKPITTNVTPVSPRVFVQSLVLPYRQTRHTKNNNNDNGGQQSGSGLQHTNISTAVLEKAIGPEVMRAVAAVKASDAAGGVQEGLSDAADASRSSLNTLIGTETTGGALQVTVAGRGRKVAG